MYYHCRSQAIPLQRRSVTSFRNSQYMINIKIVKISLVLIFGAMVDGPLRSQSLFAWSEGQNTVYVCMSKGATRYHLNKECHGLKRCKHKIESTTVKKAVGKGLTLCKFED